MMKRKEEENNKKEEELKTREQEMDKREEELKEKARKLEELEHSLMTMRKSMESASMTIQSNSSASRNNISSINSSFNTLKTSARKTDFSRYNRDRSFSKTSTTASKKKPPTIRKSFRENSVGSKLRYQFNKENMVPNKAYPTKYDLSRQIKYKGRNSSRVRETSSSHKEFRPPLSGYNK